MTPAEHHAVANLCEALSECERIGLTLVDAGEVARGLWLAVGYFPGSGMLSNPNPPDPRLWIERRQATLADSKPGWETS